MSEQDRIALEEIGAEVNEALALTERRIVIERMQQANDAALVRLAQTQGVGIKPESVLGVRLQVLIEQLLGGMDDTRRLDYEAAVQAKFTELIADIQQQAARAKLLNGVRLDRPPTP